MKIYALHDVETFDHLGYYSTRMLAYLAAQDHYNDIEGISYTFDEYWERNCHLDELTVVTRETMYAET